MVEYWFYAFIVLSFGLSIEGVICRKRANLSQAMILRSITITKPQWCNCSVAAFCQVALKHLISRTFEMHNGYLQCMQSRRIMHICLFRCIFRRYSCKKILNRKILKLAWRLLNSWWGERHSKNLYFLKYPHSVTLNLLEEFNTTSCRWPAEEVLFV